MKYIFLLTDRSTNVTSQFGNEEGMYSYLITIYVSLSLFIIIKSFFIITVFIVIIIIIFNVYFILFLTCFPVPSHISVYWLFTDNSENEGTKEVDVNDELGM